MASSWRYPNRTKYRAKVPQDPEDYYRLDPKKSNAENAYDIYTALCCRDTRDTKRLFLLNGLATLCQQQQSEQQTAKSNLGFNTEELLYGLSASLVHTFTQVRAAALRTIRYILVTPRDVKIFNSMQLQHLICRSIDVLLKNVLLKNDDERVQALKLIRKMLAISPADINPVLVRCLVSLADSGIEDGDNMLRACLATLCEFAVLNPTLLIVCGGVTAITRNVLECHNPRIAESLCGVLLYLLEWPQTRNISGVRLDCLAAPYCDFTYRLGIMDKNKDARELRYTSCRLALLSVLRSWTGTIEFCNPSKPSGLKAIVDTLYLNQIEVRKAILDLLYELLNVPQLPWTDDYLVALQTVDPSDFQDAWLLSNGFVAMEGRCILPSLAARAPNVCEQHLSLLLYCFLETGLLNALVEVIRSSDAHLSVRATVLIGKILNLMHTHLPADICSTSPALPTLISHATQGNQNATAAISALQNYQKMLRNRPASCSLFLDSIIQGGSLIQTRLFRREINAQDHARSFSGNALPSSGAAGQITGGGTLGITAGGGLITGDRQRLDSVSSSDESNTQSSSSRRSSFRFKRKLLPFFENQRVAKLIRDSNVLASPDISNWDWEIVITILRSNVMRRVDDTVNNFLKTLLDYYKPSKNRFSHEDLAHGRAIPAFVVAGLDFIDWLLASPMMESIRILTDYFSDISKQLLAVSTSSRVHDCLFSPQHMSNTMCQQYFLYIGRMCRVQKGIRILTDTAVFEHLINLVRNTDHICYVKLTVSGLDYSLESVTRKVLEKALTAAKIRSGRLYATQFLTVLLRARLHNFEVWGIPLIIQQTKDPDRSVVLAALDVLEEACHEKYYLEEIVSIWPNLKSLGDVGRLLMARYYSLSRGLNHLKARIQEEIEYWKNGYNKRYVLLVDANTHSSLTLHVRNEDGHYSRRNCNTRPIIIPPNIAPHLYGQMIQTAQGTTALRKYGDLPHLVEVISRGKCSDDAECLDLKAAIWAVGHASTHSNGIEYFTESGSRIYEKLVILATKCVVYSIRATCFNVLGLIGGTNDGANILYKLNWLSVRHDRNTVWPVHQPEDWMSNNYTPVRHHYEDMPPYNYTGIDDQIDGSYTGSYWNLLLSSSSTTGQEGGGASASSDAPDATNAENSKTCDDNATTKPPQQQQSQQQAAAVKSKTLPEGTHMRHGKHQRSLSESKTTDVISLISGTAVGVIGMYYPAHRVRYNSCTDSNTSGVSSCESVTMRIPPVGDFQQFPLSPIPSMSNLVVDLPPQRNLLLRGSSLVGASYLHTSLSPADIKGYAQLRSLRKYCRPMVSESATDVYDIIDRIEFLSLGSSVMRPRKSSFGESQRRIKVRSLDRQSSLRIPRLDFEELQQVPLPTLAAPKFLAQNDSKGPCYAGICLPKNLLDLFPTRNLGRTYVSRDIQDQDLMDINLLTANQQFLNDSLNNECGDESSVISSLSDVSSVSKRSKWLGAKHGRNNCMHCSRARRNRTHTQRLDSDAAAASAAAVTSAAGVALAMGGELYTSSGTLVAATTASHTARKTNKQPPITQQQPKSQTSQQNAQSSSTIQLSDISFNSPESILSDESMPDRLTASILFNVQRLANPVSAKQSKMALLELKQKHPTSFQDICLYSEVCKALGRSSYRMNARRFVQELFLDLNFDSFYAEPTDILLKKEKDFGALSERTEAEQGQEQSGNARLIKGMNSVPSILGASAAAVHGDISGNAVKSLTAQASAGGLIYMPAHKVVTHLGGKLQPLASVYEASCENLLQDGSTKLETSTKSKLKGDNTPADKTSARSKVKSLGITSSSVSVTSSLGREIQNELRITSDSDESDYEDTNRSTQWIATPSVLTNDDVDEVDYIAIQRCDITPASSTTAAFSCNTTCTSTTSSHPTISSSNCSSEQTTNSSNRSSICTVSRQPTMSSVFADSNLERVNTNNNNNNNNHNTNANLNSSNSSTNLNANVNTSASSGSIGGGSSRGGAVILENQNKKYTRGRFYTLELDLSCTKNKFPITDRSRSNANWQTESAVGVAAAAAAAAATPATTAASSAVTTTKVLMRRGGGVEDVGRNGGKPTGSASATNQISNPLTTTAATTTTTTTTSSNTNFHYRLPIMRQSYTAGIMPQIQYTNTTGSNSGDCAADISNTGMIPGGEGAVNPATVGNNVPISNQPTNTTASITTLTITKSLAASLAKPIGSLYCEKRLQALKMDAKATDT
ncbi:rapamycin-insensitive companion of mTOR isoform X1 [Anastrepha ludens]|uniref:rapamycin-insensitive companion of mTOR isoform X1 n=1 Tax=Anastrepha ludens TaxID=28586 RepID=UPI0023B0766A|nr:rapamycin-insensitive companion of mTOR isoform X1 [Anastrepha ludens]XP_053949990.1 rapamycin-insensitive companion of mTOR isoform X1 [Anastrepha ludens]XP_053949991.1 rapamycin-insensitive companion of mTOR isoform X1 [Anastrepha ludens]XP_053949992.1 rapamycin-insensitive companion of mTOR isoform X1 [Anastrepha ludens]XP_053949994.1 rapamycin-insensitive companion of mTOR isoform X1 [Anastrepha ludens]XP_053949995.1 rapamycin-insensitive companion of mTOR isoform X1 [Anastrepha ludens]